MPSATLKQLQGRVLVGHDTAMKTAQDGMPLYPGNRVVAVAGAGARVVYANGCTVALPANSVLTIEGADQCRAGRALVRTTAGFQGKAIGQTLDPAVSSLVGQFNMLNPEPLVTAYNGLNAAQQLQLVGTLSESQLTNLYVAIGSVSGESAAEGFLLLLPAAQANAVVAAVASAGAAGAAGLTIGAVTLGAAQIAALGFLTVGAIAAINESEENGQQPPPQQQPQQQEDPNASAP
ncbi:hypothetical protein [uncultured Lamprocystis sp.]|uniref:hypothetical protein n=1 Tax=uncultured Lamprocystis sp. TaxID=543132 RepID=UPI0025E9710E|nr:hypothetical protein [uncultured Lamprocystis sp.]